MVELNDVIDDQESPMHTPSESAESTESTVSAYTTQKSNPDPTDGPPEKSKRLFRLIPSFRHDPEDTPDGRFNDLTYESVASYPLGYPSWAAYQNSEPTFRIYKRFGTLRNRVILYRQQELAKLEEKLNELDAEDDKHHNRRIRSLRQDRADKESKRMELIDEIDSKLKHYDDLLERELRSGLMQKPTKRNYRSLVNYLFNRAPVVRSEQLNILKHRDDFILLTGQSESPLERTLDTLICRVPIKWFRRLFSSEAQLDKFDEAKDQHTILTSTEKIEQLARAIASLLAIFLIGVPLYVLASTNFSDRTKLTVLMVALFLFPIAIQIAARPKNHELFAATAAYCAVLSTFLATSGNFNLGQTQFQATSDSTLSH
ncbi:hypothetical protein K469DRAFT_704011 [Zopfia rhizophila CBS 207.26]|uniref:DUF6594 domain-containing protein n=1 Tax=Zopfia rhizophila CBS 207.26 TaxID=1314779 RepID=A0A6A6DB75_9PEZI|nr:hypothetical protein K469DRAFT_704011 [Zopfia rhizophila CBS 207.26]